MDSEGEAGCTQRWREALTLGRGSSLAEGWRCTGTQEERAFGGKSSNSLVGSQVRLYKTIQRAERANGMNTSTSSDPSLCSVGGGIRGDPEKERELAEDTCPCPGDA